MRNYLILLISTHDTSSARERIEAFIRERKMSSALGNLGPINGDIISIRCTPELARLLDVNLRGTVNCVTLA